MVINQPRLLDEPDPCRTMVRRLGSISESLGELRWHCFCARVHRRGLRLAALQNSLSLPIRYGALLDVVSEPHDGLANPEEMLGSQLAEASLERDHLIRNAIASCAAVADHPAIVPVTMPWLDRQDSGRAPDRCDIDFAFVRGLFDRIVASEAMRIARHVASRLRSGGTFLFSSVSDDQPEAQFIECVFGLPLFVRSDAEMRAIAAAAGRGFAKRHFRSANGALHFCEILKP